MNGILSWTALTHTVAHHGAASVHRAKRERWSEGEGGGGRRRMALRSFVCLSRVRIHFTPTIPHAHSNLFPWRNSRRVAALIAPPGRVVVVEEQTRRTRFRSPRQVDSGNSPRERSRLRSPPSLAARRKERKKKKSSPSYTHTYAFPTSTRIFGIFVK